MALASGSSSSPTTDGVRRTIAGLTLIELLVAVAIMGILASVAYPSFMSQVRKSRRADAIAALVRVQQAQERWRANKSQYTETLTDLSRFGVTAISPDGHYDITIASASASGYTATATARTTSSQYRDSSCQTMRVVLSNGATAYQAPGCFNR